MPRQRAIRFPDDLHDAIEAEAQRLGHPHTFSSVVVNTMAARGLSMRGLTRENTGVSVGRGSPSPSLERAKRSIT